MVVPLDVPVVGFVALLFGLAAFFFMLVAGLVLFALIVLIEAVVLWRFRWNAFLRSLGDSALMNLASTVVGILISLVLGQRIAAWWGLLLSFLLSVLIEFGVLCLRKSAWGPERKLLVAAVANAASYVLLVLVLVVGSLWRG